MTKNYYWNLTFDKKTGKVQSWTTATNSETKGRYTHEEVKKLNTVLYNNFQEKVFTEEELTNFKNKIIKKALNNE